MSQQTTELFILRSRADRLYWEYVYFMDLYVEAQPKSAARLTNIADATMRLSHYFDTIEAIVNLINEDNPNILKGPINDVEK